MKKGEKRGKTAPQILNFHRNLKKLYFLRGHFPIYDTGYAVAEIVAMATLE